MLEYTKTKEIDVFFIFRWLILLSIILIAGYVTKEPQKIKLVYTVIAIYFILNIAFRFIRPELFKRQIVLFVTFLLDIIIVSSVFYFTGGITSDYYIFYFLTVMVASIYSGIKTSLAITIACAGIYLWLVSRNNVVSLEDPVLLLKVVFLFLTAFISSLWNSMMKEKIEVVKKEGLEHKKVLENYLQSIINSMNSGILIFDKEEKMRIINPRGNELLSDSEENVLMIEESYKKTKESNERHQLVQAKDGRYWGLNWTTLRDTEGKESGMIAIFNDVTERIRMQREMERSHRINRLGNMTLQIVHDLRNPLGVILGLAQMLSNYSDDTKAKEYGGKILSSCERINNHIEDMLSFSREYSINNTVFDLHSLIMEVISNFKEEGSLRDQDIDIQLRVQGEECMISADREKMMRVFDNLIKNACEAIKENPKITISVSEDNKKVTTNIEDNGVGIPKSKLDEIFEPFITTKSNGTGLGLSIVQRIISCHKGKIFVESREGHGTIFTIELPKKEV